MKKTLVLLVAIIVSLLAYVIISHNKHTGSVVIVKDAENGDPIAQRYLGIMYCESKSVPQDYQKAIKW